jgi:dTDP-D-glucose 4,6-dehydratase
LKLIVTGGAGFIGSAVIRHLINETNITVMNLDKLTYAGNLESLTPVSDNPRYHFAQVDICDKSSLEEVFSIFKPDAAIHLAAESHARALCLVLEQGEIGETYNIGGHNEKTNLEVVKTLCSLLDEMLPNSAYKPHYNLINFVTDRPGHDLRYAIDATKIQQKLGWQPEETFETGLAKTVQWYLDNRLW